MKEDYDERVKNRYDDRIKDGHKTPIESNPGSCVKNLNEETSIPPEDLTTNGRENAPQHPVLPLPGIYVPSGMVSEKMYYLSITISTVTAGAMLIISLAALAAVVTVVILPRIDDKGNKRPADKKAISKIAF